MSCHTSAFLHLAVHSMSFRVLSVHVRQVLFSLGWIVDKTTQRCEYHEFFPHCPKFHLHEGSCFSSWHGVEPPDDFSHPNLFFFFFIFWSTKKVGCEFTRSPCIERVCFRSHKIVIGRHMSWFWGTKITCKPYQRLREISGASCCASILVLSSLSYGSASGMMKDMWFPLVMLILRGVHGNLLNSSVTRSLKVDSSGSLTFVDIESTHPADGFDCWCESESTLVRLDDLLMFCLFVFFHLHQRLRMIKMEGWFISWSLYDKQPLKIRWSFSNYDF